MSLSNPQKALLKRAQRDALIGDAEYRSLLATVSGLPGCNTSTDDRLADEHWDNLLAFFEAIYWRAVDQSLTTRPSKVFQHRDYWASKNRHGNTSRDRYTARQLTTNISDLENQMVELGFGPAYLAAIKRNVHFVERHYVAALQKTITAKTRTKSKETYANHTGPPHSLTPVTTGDAPDCPF